MAEGHRSEWQVVGQQSLASWCGENLAVDHLANLLGVLAGEDRAQRGVGDSTQDLELVTDVRGHLHGALFGLQQAHAARAQAHDGDTQHDIQRPLDQVGGTVVSNRIQLQVSVASAEQSHDSASDSAGL